MARPKRDPAIRRSEFIDAAARLFSTKGYNATSIRDILSEVGDRSVSPSVFYYYFDSKDEIYHAVVTEFSQPTIDYLQGCFDYTIHALDSAETPDEKGEAFVVSVCDRLQNRILPATVRGFVPKREGALSDPGFFLMVEDEITRANARMWMDLMKHVPWMSDQDAASERRAYGLAGGLDRLVRECSPEPGASEDEVRGHLLALVTYIQPLLKVPQELHKCIVDFVMNMEISA